MANVNEILKLQQDVYREKDYSTITELSRAMQTEADWLTSYVTHMSYTFGGEFGSANFPMLAMTEGMGKVRKVKHFEYKYPIIGRPKKTSIIGKTLNSGNDKPGIGRAYFKIAFSDNWFSNQQTLYSPNGYQVRVQGDPVKEGDFYIYTVQYWTTSSTGYIPVSELKAGTIWGGGPFKAPFEGGKGVTSKSYLGGTATNMTTLVRHGYNLKGNVQKKVMKYSIKANGRVFQTYSDWEMFLADLQFKEQCENDIWWSEYGKDATGEFVMLDSNTSVPVTSGAGIDQQITNTDSFSSLTYKKISQTIRDVFFNVSGATPMIDLWTGTGGVEEFSDAMKNELKGFTTVDSKQFATGTGYDMIYGAYFKAFRHKDGGMVTVRHHQMFDKGVKAEIAPLHPITGLPLHSHDFYFIDNSTYDGEPNIQYVQEEGREYQTWAVAGSIIPIGFSKSDLRASDVDGSSVHGHKSQGVQIMKPTGCFKLKCKIS